MSCPTVSTALGQAKGLALAKANCDDAKQVFAFMGLPFAKPPVGELRFEPPQKTEPWKGVYDATKSKPLPMQSDYFNVELAGYLPKSLVCNENPLLVSEDCLYLNVYTNNPDKGAKKPVLFWIYGGGFNFGGAVGYNGQVICGLHDVVLVVPQYRVNAFGFFSTGRDTKWPGNMGLLDQVMALEWTRDNIAAFGGDPGNVTIFGESAGSVSVSMHVISPMSRGLFHRAVSHSGVGTMSMLLRPDLSEGRDFLLKRLNITATEPDDIIRELKKVDAEKLIDAHDFKSGEIYMTPTVDGRFIPEHTEKLLAKGDFSGVPYIIGINSTEGAGILTPTLMPKGFDDGIDEETARMFLKKIMVGKPEALIDAVIDFYGKDLDNSDKYKWSKIVARNTEDGLFTISSINQALTHSGAGYDTYFYYLTQQLRMHHDDAYAGDAVRKPEFCEADHSEDLVFTFGYPFMNAKLLECGSFTEDEKALSRRWMKMLCQFAKTGNPNGDGEGGVIWPKYDSKNKEHLVLKWPCEVGSNVFENRFKFWTETVPALIK